MKFKVSIVLDDITRSLEWIDTLDQLKTTMEVMAANPEVMTLGEKWIVERVE
jgi:hypothetical protein